MASDPITSWQIDGETMEIVTDFIFLGSKITADGDCSHEIKRCLLFAWKAMPNIDSILKRRDITDKGLSSPSSVFSSSHVLMWELDCKESWAPTNWCFWTMVLRRLLRVPWTARRSNQSILKEISPQYSLEELTQKLFTPILWPPDAKNWLIGKDPDGGQDWRQEKGMTENEMVEWHHRLDGYESEQTGNLWWTGKPGVLQSVGSQRDTTVWLNWTESWSIG